jgi:hypothetical protein
MEPPMVPVQNPFVDRELLAFASPTAAMLLAYRVYFGGELESALYAVLVAQLTSAEVLVVDE